MSYSGDKRPLCRTSRAVLLTITLVHLWASSGLNQTGAIRVIPVQRHFSPVEPPPPAGRFFNGGDYSDVNGTTRTANSTSFLDYKRRIPSCPDPLHN
ncbi:CLAVATA3/ESR (CLE)-related protein 27 [Striga hermonthica]|uniref:CLAVATA3/ESR (CLE)-related protein 27 n=1 Tax=Striga hermonthica TaxID=68872 RepID=A0A9N7R977_STRHE|nr:CLAVATA3/ESR (CLE)-related protein 27 [Striga hermonthica]